MPGDTSVKLTLSIWRDFVPPRPLIRTDEEGSRIFDSDSGLQQLVYSWPLREDAFSGIASDGTRSDLHNRLVHRLADSKPPSERGLDVLREFVEASEAAVNEGQVSPLPSESRSDENPGDEGYDRVHVNSLLALTIHLKWIVACFGHRPGISVSVR